jgi:hypothetical protein
MSGTPPLETVMVVVLPLASVIEPAPEIVSGAFVPLKAVKLSGLFAAVVRPLLAAVAIVPVVAVPVAFNPWPLARVNAVVKVETSKVEPPASTMLGELAIEPVPLRASVPPLIVVSPV